ncbi:MAG: hypothetical protein WBP26_05015 [Candidatus Saccharimonadales bacterium]
MTQVWTANSGTLVRRGYAIDVFELGVTKPKLDNPESPTADDNVGAAYGWNGVTLTVMNGDQTVPANTTWTNRLINGYVDMTDSTSRLINCVIAGRAPGGAFRAGLVNGANGGYLERCTVRTTATSATYYMNGIRGTGGTWTIVRCDISRVVDGLRTSGSGGMQAFGCRMHDYSFWDTDNDQAGDQTYPYWSHGDIGLQRTSGTSNTDRLEGCSVQGYFDVTGVVWSGGAWGSGTASGGLIGAPSTALNNGFPNRNYSNLVTYSSTQPYSGMVFLNNWFDGGNHPSGMVQMTVAGAHNFRLEGNRFGLGGKVGGAQNRIYLATYASASTVNFGSNPNIFDNLPNVPTSLRGQAITFISSGASVVPGDYS